MMWGQRWTVTRTRTRWWGLQWWRDNSPWTRWGQRWTVTRTRTRWWERWDRAPYSYSPSRPKDEEKMNNSRNITNNLQLMSTWFAFKFTRTVVRWVYASGLSTVPILLYVRLGCPWKNMYDRLIHRVHIFTRDETGLVCLPTQLERTLQLYWWW